MRWAATRCTGTGTELLQFDIPDRISTIRKLITAQRELDLTVVLENYRKKETEQYPSLRNMQKTELNEEKNYIPYVEEALEKQYLIFISQLYIEMAGKSVDEFWNTSSSTSFNFDDDFEPDNSSYSYNELISPGNTSTLLPSSLESSNNLNVLPIHSLVTKRNLDAKDVRIIYQTSAPSVQETIIKMFLGMPYSLTIYRSLNQKLELLDEAVNSEDGNIILTVLLFLKNSLEVSELYRHLSNRKVALRHYANYLIREMFLQQLSVLCLECGNYSDLIFLYYTGLDEHLTKDKLQIRLLRFLLEYQQKLSNDKNTMFIDYKNFVKWQMDNNAVSITVTEQLAALCKSHWENGADSGIIDKRISEFKLFVKMSEFQYEWIIMNALSTFKMWKTLTNLFIKPNWLTKRNSIRSVINAELIITTLYRHKAPVHVLENFITCIVDNDISLLLAKKLKCHKLVINLYAQQKDRCAIQCYKVEIPRDSEEYNYAETILMSDKRWKN
ncbi:hypothetical protein FQA39_LY00226 [Lamprigera yunnana]|nr:hypothetical protein FQA39_LY00226 [Lamprigera yunnana]